MPRIDKVRAMAKRNQQPQGKCIVCNRTGMSKEHIWSKWLGGLIPPREMHRQGLEAFTFDREAQKNST